MAWGGPKEQEWEHFAGNPNAKDCHSEALMTIEKAMATYWQDQPSDQPTFDDSESSSTRATTPNSTTGMMESEFDHHHHVLIQQSSQSHNDGWAAVLS